MAVATDLLQVWTSLLLRVWRSPSFDQLHGETSYDQLMYNYCAHFSTYLANTLLISWLTLTVHILLFTWREYSSDQLIGCYCAHLSTNMANHLLISWLAATVHISLTTWRESSSDQLMQMQETWRNWEQWDCYSMVRILSVGISHRNINRAQRIVKTASLYVHFVNKALHFIKVVYVDSCTCCIICIFVYSYVTCHNHFGFEADFKKNLILWLWSG
jgi:hypothetical protein